VKLTINNILVFLIALLVISELNARLLNAFVPESFIQFHSYYLELLFTFLILSIPNIIMGIVITKLFTGTFITYWIWGLCSIALILDQPRSFGMSDVSRLDYGLAYAAYYLPPLLIGIAAILQGISQHFYKQNAIN
jgi:hypothetical protein